MAEKMSWVFEGVDKFTGPMGAMSTSIVKFAFGINEAKELLESFAHALEFVGEKGIHFGEMALDALAFKEATLNSFEVMLGTRKQAQDMFNKAQAFADLTPFKTADVISSFQALSATFSEKEVPIVFQGVADIASFAKTREEGSEVVRSITSDLQRMFAYGKATQRDLIPILNAGRVAGLSPVKFFKGLADVMGTDVVTAQRKYEAGMVDATTGTAALLQTIKNITHMELGGAVIKQASTINGLLSTAGSLMENFFFAMSKEVEDISGAMTFKDALRNVIGYFNVLTPTGQRVAHAIERIFSGAFNAIFGGFAGPGGAQTIKDTMEKILGWVESIDWNRTFGNVVSVLVTTGKVLWGIFKGFAEVFMPVLKGLSAFFGLADNTGDLTKTLEKLGEVLGIVAASLLLIGGTIALLSSPIAIIVAGVIGWISAIRGLADIDWAYIPEQIGDMFKSIGEWFSSMWSSFKEWGASILQGIAEGITGAAGAALKAVEEVATGLMTSFKDTLGIHSPSAVFEGYGQDTTAGYVQGVEGGMGDVSNAFSGLLGPGVGGSTSGAGNTVTVTFGEGAFQIDGGPNFDAETFASKLQELLPSALAPAFERMAMQTGGA